MARRGVLSHDGVSLAGLEASTAGGVLMPSRDPFEDVAREMSGPLLRYLERLAGNQATARDLLQEALSRISRGLPGFDGRSSLRTWSFSVATRVAADHFRRPDTRAQLVDVGELAEASDDAEIEERLIVDEMNACVRGVIDGLPADYRAALVLHDLEELTAAETARVCGCSLETAKIRIHRARRRLRQALEAECCFYRDRDGAVRCDRKQP
jgi:RNA polymerase sigma-70 factor (ECF subfamily)